MNNTGIKTGGRAKGTPNKSNQEIKAILDSIVDFEVLVSKLYEKAIGEPIDTKAAQILLEYRFGKPKQEFDLRTSERQVEITLNID